MAARGRRSRVAKDREAIALRMARWLAGPGRWLSIVAVLVCITAGIARFTWTQVGPLVLRGEDYLVQPADISINPPPGWIDSDIKSQVLAAAKLDWPLRLYDESLAEQLAQAFALSPWVARVERVAKSYPAQIHVELAYRRPVAMVKSGGYIRPVDAEGVVLPTEDFSPAEAQVFPLIDGIATPPHGLGTSWGDLRVTGAASIASLFAERWQDLNFHRIVPSITSKAGGPDQAHYYYLFTHGGTRIIWGRPPGMEAAGEPTAADKIERLIRYVREVRPLDSAGSNAEFNLLSDSDLSPAYQSASRSPDPVRVD